MRRSWPFALAVIAVGAVAGVAIAGRPQPTDQFVLDSSVTVPVAPPTSTTASADTTTTSSTVPAATTTELTTTTLAATTTLAPTTVAPTEPPTTAAPTTTIAGPLPRDQVRLVLANGDGRFRLASTTADRIRPLGYVIDLGDAISPVDATVIYYRPGFDDEAAYAAIDIGVPDALIRPFPTNAPPITTSDANGDVIIVLGPDAPR